MSEYALEITELSKSYRNTFKRKTKAVDDVTLNVKPGEIFALLGPNGAGKTTLMLTSIGLLNKDKGDVRIFGCDCEDLQVKKRISYLPENPAFRIPKYLTAYEYLDFHASLKGISGREKAQQINKLLIDLELDKDKDKRVSKYSKGMLQRLNIAQAFLGICDLLFLDEPILGLDPMGIAKVRELMVAAKNRGNTVFINSHLLSEVEQTCDHVGILIKGKLRKILGIEELSKTLYGVKIGISNINEVKDKLIQFGTIEGNCLIVTVADEQAIESIVQRIVETGGKVTSVIPQIQSLEQYFVELVRKGDERNN